MVHDVSPRGPAENCVLHIRHSRHPWRSPSAEYAPRPQAMRGAEGMELATCEHKEGPMTARAMWKADLSVGELKVPVKLYAAVRDTKVHFRLLHSADHAPVKQQMVDPDTDQPVASE